MSRFHFPHIMGERKLSIAYAPNKTELSSKIVENLYGETAQQVDLNFFGKLFAEVHTNTKVTVTS